MSKVKKPIYTVRRCFGNANDRHYKVVQGSSYDRVTKHPEGWYAKTRYHKSLRDAIIYCVFGH